MIRSRKKLLPPPVCDGSVTSAGTCTGLACLNLSVSVITLPSCSLPMPLISRCGPSGTSRTVVPAGRLIAGTLRIRVPPPTGARKLTRPPALVRTEVRLSARLV